jgi:ABC-type glucose/galactose transport system permease subunit
MIGMRRQGVIHGSRLAWCTLLAGMGLMTVLTGVGASLFATASGAQPMARAARTIALNETGRLRLTSHRHLTLNEQGTASGTIRGTIYIHLKIVSTNRVTAEVNIYPSGGSLSGYATANYRVVGPTASFTGTMSITRGTGRYAHAHGSGLSFSGTIQRSNDAVTVRLTGQMSV